MALSVHIFFCFAMFLFVVGAEAQTGQKPQDAHYCICWQPSGGQRKRSEISSEINLCVLHGISCHHGQLRPFGLFMCAKKKFQRFGASNKESTATSGGL